MLKHWLGEQNEIDVEFVMKTMGIGTPESRDVMRQALLADPSVPNEYVNEIIDLGIQAGVQATSAALAAIDTTSALGSHPGVREAVSQMGVQIASHAISTISQSVIEVLKAGDAHGRKAVNVMANTR